MANDIRISSLCDTYGGLLTERQRSVIRDYYDGDLSLMEIAENLGITRQAVRDALLKAEKQLCFYEESIGFRAKTESILSLLESCAGSIEDGDTVAALEWLRRATDELTGD